MPIWPFKKRRRDAHKDESKHAAEKAARTEQAPPSRPAPTADAPPAPPQPTQPIPIPNKRATLRKRRRSQDERAELEKLARSSEKENVPPPAHIRQQFSHEEITALPMSHALKSSPHLRAIDNQKPAVPYNFRPYSTSQSSLQQDNAFTPVERQKTLRSRRSGYDSNTLARRQSSRRRKKEDQIREEEIRAMSAQVPLPKRPGEGPLRRDSKKFRGSLRGSVVSLPGDEDVHSTMSSITEQRGWQIGTLDMFNPRPAVRLSGTPQGVTPGSLPSSSKGKEKVPPSRDSARKRETIGHRADNFDASDLRLMLERDRHRKESRKKDQTEKLDQKLRNRGGRNRGDSDRKRRDAEEAREAEQAQERAREEARIRDVRSPPTAVHPALRNIPAEQKAERVGLGIDEPQAEAGASESEDQYLTPDERRENPFGDEAATDQDQTPTMPQAAQFSPVQTPTEDPVVETAREVRLSQVASPPLSSIQAAGATSSLAEVVDERRLSDLPPPPPIRDPDTRRRSDPKPERRGAWGAFLRRVGSTRKKSQESTSISSEMSFVNTSRESMRNRPLPPHLVDTQAPVPRRTSGTPARTQSKFRENLPEIPISPPDSRMPSPDVTSAAAAAAVARRSGKSAPVDIPRDSTMAETEMHDSTRNDTPISPSIRSQRIISMGSIDSEASWLASGSVKRHSTQSGVNRSIGSLNQLRGTDDELGGDRDTEYFQRMTPSPETKRAMRGRNTAVLTGDTPDEESEEEAEFQQPGTPGIPLTVHGSVRRKPEVVHRDPRVRSREGLLTEYSGAVGTVETAETPEPASAATGSRGSMLDFDEDEPEPELQRASSVGYRKSQGHARHVSSGSAKLLNLNPQRESTDPPSAP